MERILISRTDSIGDVILTLPMAGILKEIYPNAELYFLGRSYTETIVNHSEHISQFLNWDELQADSNPFGGVEADAFVHVFPVKKIAKDVKKSGIPIRIGTSHRFFHLWTCNRRVDFSRKNSPLHESQLNLKLLQPFGYNASPELSNIWQYVGWRGIDSTSPILPENGKFNLILHVKSKGSALEWPLDKYLKLAETLKNECNIILTGTHNEGELVDQLCPELRKHPSVVDTFGTLTIQELINLIGSSDGLVACSTGPLHIAGVSGISTLGLYPSRRPMHPGRWSPIGERVSWLTGESDDQNQLDIDTNDVLKVVETWINK